MKRVIIKLIFLALASLLVTTTASAGINDGLVAYYPFNGNANDESGNGNHGVAYGARLTYDRFGLSNSAYFFDGVDDYINIGQKLKRGLPMSVSAWVKVNDLANHNGVFRNDAFGSYYYGINFSILKTGQIEAYFGNGGYAGGYSRNNKLTNESLIKIGVWYHIVANINGRDNMQIFVNGTERVGSYDGTASGVAYSSSDGLIGLVTYSNPPKNYFNGIIDQVRIYSRALSASEIQSLYNYSPEYTYYLPYFKNDTEMGTGVGLRNLNDSQNASIILDIFDENGMSLSTENENIPSRGQKAWMVGNNLTAEGWIEVESDQPLGGLCFLSYGLDYMADIPITDTLSKELVVPHVGQSEDWDTTIYICNPNDTSVEISLTFVNADGSPRFTQYYDIPANGSGKYDLLDLVQDENYVNGSVEISADNEITAFALYFNQKTGGGCFSGINAVKKK